MPSKDKQTLYTVLLPTYNERDNIAIVVWLLIRTFVARCDVRVFHSQCAPCWPARQVCCCCSGINYEIVIVDDNSQDDTQGVVRQLQDRYGDEKIVSTLR